MRRCTLSTAILVMLFMLLVCISVGHAQEGTITGRVSLTDKKGEVVYGDWVRVFLTTSRSTYPPWTWHQRSYPWSASPESTPAIWNFSSISDKNRPSQVMPSKTS